MEQRESHAALAVAAVMVVEWELESRPSKVGWQRQGETAVEYQTGLQGICPMKTDSFQESMLVQEYTWAETILQEVGV